MKLKKPVQGVNTDKVRNDTNDHMSSINKSSINIMHLIITILQTGWKMADQGCAAGPMLRTELPCLLAA